MTRVIDKGNHARKQYEYDWFYRKKAWLNIRTMALNRDNYLCRKCVRLNKAHPNPAVIVHHIIPITKDFNKALKLDNLESLCLECHNKVHPEKGGNRLSKDGFFVGNVRKEMMFDEYGNLIERVPPG